MRWALGVVALLIAMAVVLSLTGSHARRSVEMAGSVSTLLPEAHSPRPFDARAAATMLDSLERWLGAAQPPEGDLRRAAVTAGEWAAGSTPGTGAHRTAVKLRGAAVALLGPGGDGRRPRREEARQHLDEARRSLADDGTAPQGAVEGLRNQLENLQHGQRERLQEAERSLR